MENESALQAAEIVAGQCLAGRARRLNRVITGLYDRALRPYGIKVNQIGLLVRGEAGPGEVGARPGRRGARCGCPPLPRSAAGSTIAPPVPWPPP